MKPSTFTFDIPAPCHEKWADMEQRPNGKYCQSCQKTVIDFSKMPDREVAAYFRKTSERTCGKFRSDQLHRPVHFEQPKRFGNMLRAFGLLVPGLLAGAAAQGQTTPTHPTEQVEGHPSPTLPGDIAPQQVKSIKGVVKDTNGEPLIGVSILVKGTGRGTVTDIDGSYSINVLMPADGGNVILQFSYTGFISQEKILTAGMTNINVPVNMEESYIDSGMIGVIVIQRDQTMYRILKNKIRNIAWHIRSKIKAKKKEKKYTVEQESSFYGQPKNTPPSATAIAAPIGKTYPNPFSSGFTLELERPAPETLNVRLLDLDGRIVFSKKEEALAGKNNIHIRPNISSLINGNYIMEVSGAGGMYFSEMVVYNNGQ